MGSGPAPRAQLARRVTLATAAAAVGAGPGKGVVILVTGVFTAPATLVALEALAAVPDSAVLLVRLVADRSLFSS